MRAHPGTAKNRITRNTIANGNLDIKFMNKSIDFVREAWRASRVLGICSMLRLDSRELSEAGSLLGLPVLARPLRDKSFLFDEID